MASGLLMPTRYQALAITMTTTTMARPPRLHWRGESDGGVGPLAKGEWDRNWFRHVVAMLNTQLPEGLASLLERRANLTKE